MLIKHERDTESENQHGQAPQQFYIYQVDQVHSRGQRNQRLPMNTTKGSNNNVLDKRQYKKVYVLKKEKDLTPPASQMQV